MNSTKISQILTRLMAKHGLRVTELARQVNLAQPTVHRIVSGVCENPHPSSLKPLADYFKISIDQLRGLSPIPEFDKIAKIPLLEWHEIERWINNKLDLSHKEYIISDAFNSSYGYALQIKDNSMEPIFPKGTQLTIDPHKAAKDRSYVIVKLATASEAIFRQLIINGSHSYLKALSPDLEKYKLTALTKTDKVLGCVIQAKHTYND